MKTRFTVLHTLASRAYSAASDKALILGVALAAPLLSHAQVTDPFEAAVADVTTKVGTYGAALVGVAAAAVVFMVAIKYVKKIPRAS